MGRLCQDCQKREATMHFTDIKDGKKTESHLCKQCAQKRQKDMAFPTSILSAIVQGGGAAAAKSESEAVPAFCPSCGLAYSDFKAKGRLGCPSCYDAFAPVLVPLLEKVHGAAAHAGKAPSGRRRVIESRKEIEELEARLAAAVEAEDYEAAAELRDTIRQLKGKPAE
jgi:protein arginine kinase activator